MRKPFFLKNVAGIYVHIPFCKQACHYCDFYFSTSLKNKDAVINALVTEIKSKKYFFGTHGKVKTIYFGGGTPSILEKSDFEKILNELTKTFALSDNIEFTIEANPDDITKSKLIELKSLGVNRLSIGIQSFDDNDLKLMNRSHNANHALNCVQLAKDIGFENISIDLMYGLPNQTNDKWQNNLKIVQNLEIQHISCYCLTIEERTALHQFIKEKKIEEIDELISVSHFKTLMNWAKENDFEHYEISNFAKTGFRAIHNTNYWLNESYLGIGPSAHSYNGSVRYSNIRNNALYIKKTNENECYFEIEVLTKTQLLNEYLLTNLRTSWGINVQEITSRFGINYSTKLNPILTKLITKGLLILKNNNYKLSEEGKFFADNIAGELFF